MAFVDNADKVAMIVERAAEDGRVFVPLDAAELTERFGRTGDNIQIKDASGAFSVYYGRYYKKWCLIGIGPVMDKEKIKKAMWAKLDKSGPEWTPLESRPKRQKPSDIVTEGAFVFGMLPGHRVLMGRVESIDRFGHPQSIETGDGITHAEMPGRWQQLTRSEAAKELFNTGRAEFGSFQSLVSSLYQRDRRSGRVVQKGLKLAKDTAPSTVTKGAEEIPAGGAAPIDPLAIGTAVFKKARLDGVSLEEARILGNIAHASASGNAQKLADFSARLVNLTQQKGEQA